MGNSKITIRHWGRNEPDSVERQIEPTFRAVANLLYCSISQLCISIYDTDEISIASPDGDGAIIKFADFKKFPNPD